MARNKSLAVRKREVAFSRNLRIARKKANLSQTALAQVTGLSAPTISQIETGRHSASLGVALVLAEAVGVTLESMTRRNGLVSIERTDAYDRFRLCLIKDDVAYFTDAPLDKQWGDDWNDIPFEHNAGKPYTHYTQNGEERKASIRTLYIEGGYGPEGEFGRGSRVSVDMVNRKAMPWRSTSIYHQGEAVHIWAGATMREFIDAARKAGWSVYVPLED